MQGRIFVTGVLLACVAATAGAAERVTLRNGFEMHCNHHADVGGRVRLYLGTAEDSYIDLAPEEIASVDVVADPMPAAEGSTRAVPTRATTANADAKLSPADLHQMLAKAGDEHNVDVDLLASLVKAESNGNAHAVSRTGAKGLMQLMPGTASELGVQDSFRPDENVRGGSAYLDALLTRYHDNVALALAAYNAGPQAVDKYHGIPPYHETRVYVARVIHEFNRRVRVREAVARATAQGGAVVR
jgi:soluble lytic murein transglycosylase-like protein